MNVEQNASLMYLNEHYKVAYSSDSEKKSVKLLLKKIVRRLIKFALMQQIEFNYHTVSVLNEMAGQIQMSNQNSLPAEAKRNFDILSQDNLFFSEGLLNENRH